MEIQVSKRFAWVIKDFSALQCDKCYSVPVMIGDCKWRLCAFPKGRNENYLCMYLDFVDFDALPCGWRRYVKFRLTIVKQVVGEQSVIKDVEVLQGIGTSEESDEAYEPLTNMKKLDDGAKFSDSLNQTQQVKESIEVNGFQVLPSQVNLKTLKNGANFTRDMAVEFRATNLHLRTICMNFVLGLIETLCQSLEELSNEDIVEADIALTYVKDAGFKVNWLEEKLDQVIEKKEKERYDLAELQEMEDNLLKLKQICSVLDALVEKKKDELSVTRSPLSFDDVV